MPSPGSVVGGRYRLTISSDNLAHPFHITGMYMSPSEGMVEEFFQILSKLKTLPPNEPYILKETITHK